MLQNNRIAHLSLSVALLLLAGACTDYESFTQNPSARLEFSADTIAFDTIVSTVPSATKTLTVYNRNSSGLRISSVRLANGSSSHFRVNVDGEWLSQGQGEDFRVYRKDSIIVRIEVTVPKVGSNEIGTTEDILRFQLESGHIQEVVLTAGAIDAYMVHGMIIGQDSTLLTDKPYLIYDSLHVAPGACLTLPAGTRLMFHDDATIHVYGRINAEGTNQNPVVFRCDRMDHMFDYLLYDNTPNRWQGINIHAGSTDNRFVHCDIHAASYGIICDSTDMESTTLTLESTIIHNVGGDGLRLDNCKARVSNTQISNTQGDCVYIFGGDYTFVHCTIAQFYPFTANRGNALYLANNIGDQYRELRQAHFINCVITGYGDDVIMGSISEGQDYVCPYLFSHCYLNTIESQDTTRFSHVIYDTDEQPLCREKNFMLFDTQNFLYDFTPDSLSTIRSLADILYSRQIPLDLKGRSRVDDEAPDAGCYEYVAP
ncbi:MAG: right-handed parallel beta-helix repeat-containing protein [Bacteroidaceae bacterium]